MSLRYKGGYISATDVDELGFVTIDDAPNVEIQPVGQVEYTTPGTYEFTVPDNVTSVSAVAVGAGGGGYYTSSGGSGGAGGGLGYVTSVAVTPGDVIPVTVGSGGPAVTTGDTVVNGEDSKVNLVQEYGYQGFGIYNNTSVEGLGYSPDGSAISMVDNTLDSIHSIVLKTPKDHNSYVFSPYNIANMHGDRYIEHGFTEGNAAVIEDCAFGDNDTKFYILRRDDGIYQYDLSTAGDISTATYASKTLDVTAETATSNIGFVWKADGTSLYVVDSTNDAVYQYDLTTAWDVSTGSYASKTLNFSANATDVRAIRFKPDGTKMYLLNTITDDLSTWTLSTAWDVTTATYTSIEDFSSLDTSMEGFDFSSDGHWLLLSGEGNDSVYSAYLSTAWDVSTKDNLTAWYSSVGTLVARDKIVFSSDGSRFLSVSYNYNTIYEYRLKALFHIDLNDIDTVQTGGVSYSSDGRYMYMAGDTNNTYQVYELGTANNPTSFTYLGTFQGGAWQAGPSGIEFYKDDKFAYEMSGSSDTIYTYFTGFESLVPTDMPLGIGSRRAGDEFNDVSIKPDGTRMFAVGRDTDKIYSLDMSTAHDISTARLTTNSGSLSFLQQDQCFDIGGITNARLLAGTFAFTFGNSGTKLYLASRKNQVSCIYQYNLSTAYDLSSVDFSTIQEKIVTTETSTTFHSGIVFSSDGTNMYLTDSGNDDVDQYTLSTAWDISTATYLQSFDVSSQETTPEAILFSSDGTKMLVGGYTTDAIYEYSLTTAWDVSTASYTNNSLSVSAEELTMYGMDFNSDGTALYVIGNAGDDVNKYTLTTPYDITTATFDSSSNSLASEGIVNVRDIAVGANEDEFFVIDYQANQKQIVKFVPKLAGFDISSENAAPLSIWVKPDGTKMYVSSTATVWQYALSTAWDLSTASYESKSFAFGAPTVYGISFSSDGTKLLVSDTFTDHILRYDLTTAWDISTASLSNDISTYGLTPLLYFGTGERYTPPNYRIVDMRWINDGDRLVALSDQAKRVYSFGFASPYTVGTTATQTFYNYSTNTEITTTLYSADFNSDGTKMYLTQVDGVMLQYSLSTAWNVSTATYDSVSASLGNGGCWRQRFNSDGTKMWTIHTTPNDEIIEYTLSTAYDLSTITEGTSVTLTDVGGDTTGFEWLDNGSTLIVSQTSSGLHRYSASTAYDISTLSYESEVQNHANTVYWYGWTIADNGNVVADNGSGTAYYHQYHTFYDGFDPSDTTHYNVPSKAVYSSDGTELYVCDYSAKHIKQYDLSTAYTLSTKSNKTSSSPVSFDEIYSLNTSFSFSAETTVPTFIRFNDDGTKLYTRDNATATMLEYDLSTAYDVTTLTYSTSFESPELLANSTVVYDAEFKPDGTKMYLVSPYSNGEIHQYSLSTAWDITTATYDDKKINVYSDLTTLSGNIAKMQLDPTGTKLYWLNNATDVVFQGVLSTAWDISTATFPSSAYVYRTTSGETTPTGFRISPNGRFLYYVGSTGDTLGSIELHEPWVLASYNSNYIESTTQLPDAVPQSVLLHPDGDRLWITGTATDSIHEIGAYSQSRIRKPGVVSGFFLSEASNKLYVATASTTYGLTAFKLDANNDVATLDWSTDFAGPVLDAVFLSQFAIGHVENTPYDAKWSRDGKQFFISGGQYDAIAIINASHPFDPNSFDDANPKYYYVKDNSPYLFSFTADGTHSILYDSGQRDIFAFKNFVVGTFDTVIGYGGKTAVNTSSTPNTGTLGNYYGDGGGIGGTGGQSSSYAGGGGGAGGYGGDGGPGGLYIGSSYYSGYPGVAGAGGGGGGANASGTGGGGGATGLKGKGNSGTGGGIFLNSTGFGGGGGSGGESGNGYGTVVEGSSQTNPSKGGTPGGGGGGSDNAGAGRAGAGGDGGVRIIWGPNRSYPSTNTADK